ncbi:MAG TPA: serine hydrolase [Dehalococcoidia bacterium]|nr:serine hydrolase [Dehalococcoidia bacterium]
MMAVALIVGCTRPAARPGSGAPVGGTPAAETPLPGSSLGPETASDAPPPPVLPLPENVALSPQLAALLSTLVGEVETYSEAEGGIDVAIAVTDVQTGQTLSISGNVLHRTGCTINLFALLAATERFQAGAADPGDYAYSIRVGIGSSYPPEVKRFLEAVFGSQEEGAAYAQSLMRSWGLLTSVFDHVPYYGDGDTNNYLTALETNLTLAQLYRGQLLSPEWSAYALEVLMDIDPGLNYMLPGLLPENAVVAHKIGYYWDGDGWVTNDAGIVLFDGADGQTKAYTISYFAQQAATEYIGSWLAARLSGIVWDYFAGMYGAGENSYEPGPPPYYAPATDWQAPAAQEAPDELAADGAPAEG